MSARLFDRLLVLGHRASRREGVYENSPQAFAAAARYADGLETDAVLSADGEIFFIHDMTCSATESFSELDVHIDAASRAMAAGRDSSRLTGAELRRLRLVDGQALPDFPALLSATAARKPGFLFNIEIRAVGIFDPLVAAIRVGLGSAGLTPEQFVITSFDWPELAVGRALCPEARIGVLFEPSNLDSLPIYPGRGHEDRRFTPFDPRRLDDPLLGVIAPDFLCLNEYDLRPDSVRAIAARFPQARLMVWWYYDEPAPRENHRFFNTLRALEKDGLDRYIAAVITDHPRAMKTFLTTGA